MLSFCGGNYRVSRHDAIMPITHSFHPLPDQKEFSYCQRYFGMSSTTLELRTHFSSCGSQYPGVTSGGF
jgi:hypothetical protein